jgi:hypothetical protein
MAPDNIITRSWGNSKGRGKHSVSATIPTRAAGALGVDPGNYLMWHIEYEPGIHVSVRKATAAEIKKYLDEQAENRKNRLKGKKEIQ